MSPKKVKTKLLPPKAAKAVNMLTLLGSMCYFWKLVYTCWDKIQSHMLSLQTVKNPPDAMERKPVVLMPTPWGITCLSDWTGPLYLSSQSGRLSIQCILAVWDSSLWWARIRKRPLTIWKDIGSELSRGIMTYFLQEAEYPLGANFRAWSVHLLLSNSLFLIFFSEKTFSHVLSLTWHTCKLKCIECSMKMMRSLKFFWRRNCNSPLSHTRCSV